MKLFIFILVLGSSLQLCAQSRPQSLLARIPYVAESTTDNRPSLLNVEDALQALDPLPDFQIPTRLPNEFVLTEQGREFMELSLEANRFLQAGEPEEAVKIFQKTLEKWPDEAGIRVAYADSLYAMGDHQEAAVQYKKVLEQIPFHFQCLNNLAWLYATTPMENLKNIAAAESLAQEAKILQPTSHHIWSTLSQIYFEQGQYAEAQNAINNALVIAQRTQVNLNVVVSYLIQRDRCTMAVQATSLME